MSEDFPAEAAVVRDLAFEAARPAVLDPGKHYAWRKPDGNIAFHDLSDNLPAFKAGTVTVRDVTSFHRYWERHADEDSELFADISAGTVTGVLDAHRSVHSDYDDQPRWQRHRLVLKLKPTTPWETWLSQDRTFLPQVQFAEFLEDHYRDLAPREDYPDGIPYVAPADFLEMAQHFTISTKVVFESGQRLATGETELTYAETSTASGGKQRKVVIPQQFCLAIAPYDDCGRALISARFRYRPSGTVVTLGYFLDQPARVAEDAVREIAALVSDATGRDVMLGVPSP